MSYEVLPHTADVGIKVKARDLSELFRDAAHGMFSFLIEAPPVTVTIRERAAVEADDLETLLVSWLNELLYLFNSQKIVPVRFENLAIAETAHPKHAISDVLGEFFDPGVHRQLREIKSATYHNLKVEKTPSGYETTIIFDV